jgi:hypothetical protein
MNAYFIFSSHNRDYRNFNRFRLYKFSLNPIKLLSGLTGVYNHTKNKKYEIQETQFSIINTSAHNFSLMRYYIGVLERIEQLIKVGFRGPFDAYDLLGNKIPIDIKNVTSWWIYYCLKK